MVEDVLSESDRLFKVEMMCYQPLCVRDWSGILCERRRMLESETDIGGGVGCWKRGSVEASKDIAESPTA